MNMQSEEWRPVVGWEGFYEVSSHGGVRSVDRVAEVKRPSGTVYKKRLKGQKRKPWTDKKGYLVVTLQAGNGPKRGEFVHLMVARAFFVGPFRPGPQCRHLDGDKLNNRYDNLYIGTAQENIDDKAAHGTEVYGEDRWNSKLSRSSVLEIRRLKDEGAVTQKEIAKMFGVSPATICMVLKGKTWQHDFPEYAEERK